MQTGKDKKYCYGCFRIIDENETTCGVCGYAHDSKADSAQCLIPGTVIHDQYIIGKVLGQGGFGITYLAYNIIEDKKVAIKEYFPDGVVTRAHGETKVHIYSADLKESFELGVKKFFEEAKILAKFKENPNIINVYNYFLENNTAYYIMEYIDGINLKQYLKQNGGTISTVELFKIIFPILDALDEVHQNNILHRDISPENIYITKNGVTKLLDFGAARQVFGDKNKSLSVVLKPGFAPEEQYRRKGIQGPWTDIYSLGATMYFALTGQNIPDALDRLRDDSETKTLTQLVTGINSAIEKAIMKSVAPVAEDRYSSVKEFRNALIDATLSDSSVNYHIKRAKGPSIFKKPVYRISAVAAAVIILSGITLYVFSLTTGNNIFGLFKGKDLKDTEFSVVHSENASSSVSVNSDVPGALSASLISSVESVTAVSSEIQSSIGQSKTSVSLVSSSFVSQTATSSNSAPEENDFQYIISGNSAIITGYTGSGLVANIPNRLGGYLVTRIENRAFEYCLMARVTISNSVRSIGQFAFSHCNNLGQVIIGPSVESIEHDAFSYCPNLNNVTIGASVTSIGENVFSNCSFNMYFNIPFDSYAKTYCREHGLAYNSSPYSTSGSYTSSFHDSSTISN